MAERAVALGGACTPTTTRGRRDPDRVARPARRRTGVAPGTDAPASARRRTGAEHDVDAAGRRVELAELRHHPHDRRVALGAAERPRRPVTETRSRPSRRVTDARAPGERGVGRPRRPSAPRVATRRVARQLARGGLFARADDVVGAVEEQRPRTGRTGSSTAGPATTSGTRCMSAQRTPSSVGAGCDRGRERTVERDVDDVRAQRARPTARATPRHGNAGAPGSWQRSTHVAGVGQLAYRVDRPRRARSPAP